MKITLERVNKAVHLIATNDTGNVTHMDGSPAIGGENLGPRPMQLVLEALAGCSSMDVLSILKKMKQEVTSYQVEVEGQRDKDAVPAVFTDIHVHYLLEGDLDAVKVARSIQLSMEKYCSVTKMLESTVNITHSFSINGKAY